MQRTTDAGNCSAGVGEVLVHFSAKDLVVDWDKVHDLEFVRKLYVPKAYEVPYWLEFIVVY